VITTATGGDKKGQLEVLHNPGIRKSSSNKPTLSALVGFGKQAKMAKVNDSVIFSRKFVDIPKTIDLVIQGGNDLNGLANKCSVPHRSIKSRIATPSIYKVIKRIPEGQLTPETFFKSAHASVRDQMMARFLGSEVVREKKVDPSPEECINYFTKYKIPIPQEDILKDAYAWYAQQKASAASRPAKKKEAAAFVISTDPALQQESALLHRAHIRRQSTSRSEQTREDPPGDEDLLPRGSKVIVAPESDDCGPPFRGEVVGHEAGDDQCIISYLVQVDGTDDLRSINAAFVQPLTKGHDTKQPSPAKKPLSPSKTSQKKSQPTIIAPKRARNESGFAPPGSQRVRFSSSVWDNGSVKLPKTDVNGTGQIHQTGAQASTTPQSVEAPNWTVTPRAGLWQADRDGTSTGSQWQLGTPVQQPALPAGAQPAPATGLGGVPGAGAQWYPGAPAQQPALPTGAAPTQPPAQGPGIGQVPGAPATPVPAQGPWTAGVQQPILVGGAAVPWHGMSTLTANPMAGGPSQPAAGHWTGPSITAPPQSGFEVLLQSLTDSTNRSVAAQEEANRIACLAREQKASNIRQLSRPFFDFYLRVCSEFRNGYICPGTTQTAFAASTQGLTGEKKAERCLAQLKLCAADLPEEDMVQSIEAKEVFLKALISMDLINPDPQAVNPYGLFYISETFDGTSAAQGPLLIARSATTLLQAVKGLQAADACNFGRGAIPTCLMRTWRKFLEKESARLMRIRNGCPEWVHLFERMELDIDTEHSQVIEQCRTGMPDTSCLFRAEQMQLDFIAGRVPQLRPFTKSIYDAVVNVSNSEREALNSLLYLPQTSNPQDRRQ
jgi:hypothetical protein